MADATQVSLARELARVVGAECVLAPEQFGPYCHDATIQRGLRGTPDAVVRPLDPPAVARVLRWCYEHEVAIVPRGGGTGLAGGAVPLYGGVVVSLERLRAVRALEPELGRMHVEAGLSTAHVARLARENGLLFAPDPGAAEQSQIGGNVATNAGGPHAFKYGATGSSVVGLEVALAPGELASVGGATRRDVAGYDLRALMIGSEGTLGIITAVRLELPPAPAATLPLVAFLADEEAGQRAVLALLGGGVRPAVLDFLDPPAFAATAGAFPFAADPVTERAFVLVLELDGSHAEIEHELAELGDALASASPIALLRPQPAALWRWREGLNGALAGIRGGKVSEDVCVPPERLREAIEGVAAIGEEHALPTCAWGHAGDGIVHGTFLVDSSVREERVRALRAGERLLELALRLGGTITGEHGVGYVKRRAFGVQYSGAALAAQRTIKAALDPSELLNPGKKEPFGGSAYPALGACAGND